MKSKILIMYINHIDTKIDGEALNGVSAEYFFFGENGETLESKYAPDANGVYGSRRGKTFFRGDEVMAKVKTVPGVYDGTFELSVGSDGKPILKLVDIDYIGRSVIKLLDEGKKDNAGNK